MTLRRVGQHDCPSRATRFAPSCSVLHGHAAVHLD